MDTKVKTDQFIFNTYKRNPLTIARAKGSWVWDEKGKKYLDFFSGLAVSGIGHSLPTVVKAIQKQAAQLIHSSNLYYTKPAAELAEVLCKRSFADRVFFANSGAEANEAAIKLVRKFGHSKGRHEMIVFENSFHGRTLGALAATAQPKFHVGFGPLPAGFPVAKINHIETVQAVLGPKTAGILIEPVQGEGGIRPATKEFLQQLRRLANEHGLVLVYDSVQCSLGRTGDLFSYETYGVEPDVMTLAKGLGGGMPIGAVLAKEPFSDVLQPGDHGTTFGGNPVCAAAAIEILKLLSPAMLKNVREQGKVLMKELRDLIAGKPFVKEFRGVGLMIGIELTTAGAPIVDACRAKGLLINCTQGNVLRFLPPLALSAAERKFALKILKDVLDSHV